VPRPLRSGGSRRRIRRPVRALIAPDDARPDHFPASGTCAGAGARLVSDIVVGRIVDAPHLPLNSQRLVAKLRA
jgi:hypothetical protein